MFLNFTLTRLIISLLIVVPAVAGAKWWLAHELQLFGNLTEFLKELPVPRRYNEYLDINALALFISNFFNALF